MRRSIILCILFPECCIALSVRGRNWRSQPLTCQLKMFECDCSYWLVVLVETFAQSKNSGFVNQCGKISASESVNKSTTLATSNLRIKFKAWQIGDCLEVHVRCDFRSSSVLERVINKRNNILTFVAFRRISAMSSVFGKSTKSTLSKRPGLKIAGSTISKRITSE